jgi:hypothetical protein
VQSVCMGIVLPCLNREIELRPRRRLAAAASIGQVHAALLHDGRQVAIRYSTQVGSAGFFIIS